MECLLIITLSIFIMTFFYFVLHRAGIMEFSEYHNPTIDHKVSLCDSRTWVAEEYFPSQEGTNVLKLNKSKNNTIYEMLEANRNLWRFHRSQL